MDDEKIMLIVQISSQLKHLKKFQCDKAKKGAIQRPHIEIQKN